MNAAALIELISQLIVNASGLLVQAMAAQAAGDQASLDTIHAQVVASSNALFPPDVTPVVVI